jgi:hypothetical protein
LLLTRYAFVQVRAKLEALNAEIKEQFRNLEESVR